MDNPTNIQTVLSKLNYKMKEHWRAKAYKLKEQRGKRARFANLVNLDRQAKIASDSQSMTSGKTEQKERHPAKKAASGSSFETNVSAEINGSQPGSCTRPHVHP